MEERLRILEMVREGTISVEEADRLLEALEPSRRPTGERSRVLRLQISGNKGDDLNIAVPLTLADLISGFLPKGLRITARGQDIDIGRALNDLRESSVTGRIVDFTDKKGTHVEITVE